MTRKKTAEIGDSMIDWRLLVRDHVLKSAKPLIVIVGPTAAGKTPLAIKVALWIDRELKEDFGEWKSGAEIVNADSRQLYRGMDIGTAKVREEEMQKIPHHLLDILDPQEEVTVARFKAEAEKTIDAILAKGNVPLLVGGSMLYISAIIDGLTLAPPSDPNIRSLIESEYEQDGGRSLYQTLSAADPATAANFHPNNKPYLVRATELLRMGSEKPSAMKTKTVSKYDLLILGVSVPKEELDRRIEARTQMMLDQGWIEEVERLLDQGIEPSDPGMKSVGYAEIAAMLRDPESISCEEVADIITRKTRQYAKRQMTWWKGDERIHWVGTSL